VTFPLPSQAGAFDRINSAAWLHWLLHDWVEARQLSRPDVGDFPVADLQARRFTLAGLFWGSGPAVSASPGPPTLSWGLGARTAESDS